jgi:hypothetical protein
MVASGLWPEGAIAAPAGDGTFVLPGDPAAVIGAMSGADYRERTGFSYGDRLEDLFAPEELEDFWGIGPEGGLWVCSSPPCEAHSAAPVDGPYLLSED